MPSVISIVPVLAVAIGMPAGFFHIFRDTLLNMTMELWNQIAFYFVLSAVISFLLLQFVAAPYGRYNSSKWGPSLPAWVGWIFMEVPSPVIMGLFYIHTFHRLVLAQHIFALMWLTHYVHRAFIYPLLQAGANKPMTLVTILSSVMFNYPNPLLNATALLTLGHYSERDLLSPHFAIGVVVFAVGMFVNVQSDGILRALRRKSLAAGGAEGPRGYSIPYGGMFEYVTAANYFGELVEWCGFALATQSPAAVIFALWTAANLGPRARQHHAWYKANFKEYPKQRKAIIPFLL